MNSRSRAIRILVVAALAATGLTATGSGPATAAPITAQSCLGSARYYDPVELNAEGSAYVWPGRNSFARTTSNCYDINVKPNIAANVRTCFLSSSGAYWCNAWRGINGGTWGLAATDVRDGTKFQLEVDYGIDGLIAY